jgi:neutral ceramidase
MNAGVARVDITPPVGTRLSGFAGRDWRSNGVRDPLFATAVYVEDAARSALVISIDTIGFTLTDNARLRRQTGSAMGVSPDHVLVACSHTHAGAATMGIRATGGKEAAWTREVLRLCTEAALTAQQKAAPVRRISVGTAPCSAAINRRNVSGANEDRVRALVLHSDKPIATLFHTALHPVCLGNQDRRISADWVGDARRILEAEVKAPSVFLQGCCGDINPKVRDASAIGAEVGAALLGAIAASEDAEPSLRTGSAVGNVPFRAIAPESVLQLRTLESQSVLANPESSLAARQLANADIAWVRRCRERVATGKSGPATVPFRCTSIGIGPVDIVGWPGEVFHEIGRTLTDQHPSAWPVGFAAGNPGYLYPDSALEVGGYEVDLAYRLYGERQADLGTADALLEASNQALHASGVN